MYVGDLWSARSIQINGKTMQWVSESYGKSLLLWLDSQETSKAGTEIKTLPLSFDNKTTTKIIVFPHKDNTRTQYQWPDIGRNRKLFTFQTGDNVSPSMFMSFLPNKRPRLRCFKEKKQRLLYYVRWSHHEIHWLSSNCKCKSIGLKTELSKVWSFWTYCIVANLYVGTVETRFFLLLEATTKNSG